MASQPPQTFIVGTSQPVRGILVDCSADYRLNIALERLVPDEGSLAVVSYMPSPDPMTPPTTEFSLILHPAAQGSEGVASLSCKGTPFRLDLRVWNSTGYRIVCSATCETGDQVSYSPLYHLEDERGASLPVGTAWPATTSNRAAPIPPETP